MADKKSLVTYGALVSFKDDAEKVRYLYAGTEIPDSMPDSEVERLREAGLIGPDPKSPDLQPGVALPVGHSVAFTADEKPEAKPEPKAEPKPEPKADAKSESVARR